MWEPITLAQIAMGAGKHNIIGIVARAMFRTGNRNSMIEMIDICSIFTLLKHIEAIITGVLLRFQFCLDLWRRKLAFKVTLSGIPFLCMDSPARALLYKMGMIISSLSSLFLFPILLNISPFSYVLLFPILFIESAQARAFLFPMNFTVVSIPYAFLFPMSFIVVLTPYAYLFLMLLLIPPIHFDMRIIIDFSVFACALFATRLQSVTAPIEVFRGSREKVLTFGALLLRTIIHGLNCLSFSGLVLLCCQVTRLSLFAWGNYSLARQHPDYTFFLSQRKAAMGKSIAVLIAVQEISFSVK